MGFSTALSPWGAHPLVIYSPAWPHSHLPLWQPETHRSLSWKGTGTCFTHQEMGDAAVALASRHQSVRPTRWLSATPTLLHARVSLLQ